MKTKLIILHNNDTHGALKPVPTSTYETLGGYARRATFIRQERAKHEYLLLLDAGDIYQGSRYWHKFKGVPDIKLMNMLNYDAVALGNHDADGGIEILAKRLHEANYPVLCANVTFPDNHILGKAWHSHIIKNINDFRIAIFGLLIKSRELYPTDFRSVIQITIINEIIQNLIPKLRKEADMLILLSHLGHLGDMAIAQATDNIDLIIGGHSHTTLNEILWVNDTPIVRATSGSKRMGRLEIILEKDKPPTLTDYQLIDMDSSWHDAPDITAEIKKWDSMLPPSEVLGQLHDALDSRSEIKAGGESRAANFFTNALTTYFGSKIDIAFVHTGTLRGDRIFSPGDFTNYDLIEFYPFNMPPTFMEITAPQLKIMLERGVSALLHPVGIFLSYTGLKITADISRQPQILNPARNSVITHGQRIIQAEHRGQSIDFEDEQLTFKVAMDDYIGRGGAGYFITKHGKNIQHLDVCMGDILEWYLKKHSPIKIDIEGKIKIISPTNKRE
ncbi:MAG: hypothetical protein B6242_14100 [Anaerolineaceae bacterium 4572_78]|nr:MAG: hypothetical protein B6242_14100 [Anaerolineaceae bacterium 4572_78]